MPITRFAPSPTGFLHLGHALAALVAAQAAGPDGTLLVRIEDLDQTRSRPDFEVAIHEDLAWLGLSYPTPVRRQSDHLAEYAAALDRLKAQALVYPCFCTRAAINAEIAAAGGAPQGPDGPLYPGTCRSLGPDVVADRLAAGEVPAWRLDAVKASARTGSLTFREHGQVIAVDPALSGDVVLGRRDLGIAYHLAVVHDDAVQGVDLVTRGEDLLPATHVQRLIQALLDYPEPAYAHHRLVLDAQGRRLAKRDDAQSLRSLRAQGISAHDIRARLGF